MGLVCLCLVLSCVVAVGCAAVVQGDAPGLFTAAMLRLTTRDRQQNLTASCMRQVEKQFAKPHGVEQGREVVSACTSHQHSLKVRSYAFTTFLRYPAAGAVYICPVTPCHAARCMAELAQPTARS